MNVPTHPSPQHVIQVENLSKSYGRLPAVVDLSFDVQQGEIFGFLGPNGAGKTTTLSILEGLRRADAGRIRILDLDVRTNARAIKRRIGVQLQTAIELIGPLFAGDPLSASALWAAAGLLTYTVLFAAVSAKRFLWKS
jgi:ABC-2 type transport system ATP-binding protein